MNSAQRKQVAESLAIAMQTPRPVATIQKRDVACTANLLRRVARDMEHTIVELEKALANDTRKGDKVKMDFWPGEIALRNRLNGFAQDLLAIILNHGQPPEQIRTNVETALAAIRKHVENPYSGTISVDPYRDQRQCKCTNDYRCYALHNCQKRY